MVSTAQQRDSSTRRVAYSTLYQAVGKVLGIGFGVVGFSLTSRVLGPEQFGALSTAVTFTSIFATFADLGLPVLHLRLLALRRGSDGIRIANLHTLRVLTTLVIMTLCVVVARVFFSGAYGPEVQGAILILSLGYVAVSYTQYLLAIFQEQLRTGRAALAEAIGRGVMLATIAGAAYLGWGFDAYVWASTVGSVAAFVLSYVLVLKLWRPRLSWQPHLWPDLIRQALPLVLLTAFQIVYFKVDTLLLGLLRGNHEVGIYTAAYKFMDVFITFPALFTTLVLPFLARTAANPVELRRIFTKALRAVVIVALPLAIVTAIEGDRLVVLLSGDEFNESGAVLRLLSIAVLPLFIGNLGTTAMIAIGRASAVAWLFGAVAAGGVALYFPAIQVLGYWGAAAGTIAVEGTVAVVSLVYVLRRVRGAPVAPFARTLLAGLGAGGVALLVRSLPLPAALAATAAAYALLLFATRSVALAEVQAALLTGRAYRA